MTQTECHRRNNPARRTSGDVWARRRHHQRQRVTERRGRAVFPSTHVRMTKTETEKTSRRGGRCRNSGSRIRVAGRDLFSERGRLSRRRVAFRDRVQKFATVLPEGERYPTGRMRRSQASRSTLRNATGLGNEAQGRKKCTERPLALSVPRAKL